MAAQNGHHGSGSQNNYNAQVQNISYGRDQINHAGEVTIIDVGRDFVRNVTTTASSPHKNLWDAIANVGASHTAEQQFEHGECLEGTRTNVIRNIHEWRNSKKRSSPICWLSGTAGVGKTAIALTVARSCEEEDGLVASFFFFRSDPKRNNPSALVPTIAHGLVVNKPSARALVNQRISDDPKILEAKLEIQFRELILKPSLQRSWWRHLLAKLKFVSAPKEPNVVIIDGLDECGDEPTQRRILSTILSSYQQSPRFPLRFLICSRPEAWIQEAFHARDLNRITDCIVLDDSFMPDKDIEYYYLHEFQAIRAEPRYARVQFPTPWPSPQDLACLVQKASSQFVYAATAVRFIALPDFIPTTQLRLILNYSPENGLSEPSFSRLDQLYHVILSSNAKHERLLSVLAAIFILPPYVPPSPDFIELLLGLAPGEVDLTLRSMHSVLRFKGGDMPIDVYHTSFTDFLYDPSRSKRFYIDKAAHHDALACQWLRTLTQQIQADPKIILDVDSSSSLSPNVRHLLNLWVVFCLADNQFQAKEVRAEQDNFIRNILSVFPEQEDLFAGLTSFILLPVVRGQDLLAPVLGGGCLSKIKLLVGCQLATATMTHSPDDQPDLQLEPFFLDFLSNSCDINLPKYRDVLARRWVQALLPNQPTSRHDVERLQTFCDGWADFCFGIGQPSSGLLSDLQNLDLSTVVTGAINRALLCNQMPPVIARPFRAVTRPFKVVRWWLTSRIPSVPATLIHRFSEALAWFEHKDMTGSEESPPQHQFISSKRYHYVRDRLYRALLNANPHPEQTRLILAAILILPEYLEPTQVHIELVLGLPPKQVALTSRAMYSVLQEGKQTIIRINEFFRDYLVDRSRSLEFYIDIDAEKHVIARTWLQNLSTSKIQTYSYVGHTHLNLNPILPTV
ncbi:hypothetical protein PQX77_017271 [Marasmius sp. AFHP31]|nr:hypothetical protein PQX77_017271 [Marasmius sp. AFHP31]